MNDADRATAVHSAAAEGFSRRAHAYARGRPDYPPQRRAWLLEDLGLRAGKVVLDLGAGTGKFTRTLLATGVSVIAVDPVPQMLEQLQQAAPGAEAMVGAAEQIPLADSAVDAGVCAQAFRFGSNRTRALLSQVRRLIDATPQLAGRDEVTFPYVTAAYHLVRLLGPGE